MDLLTLESVLEAIDREVLTVATEPMRHYPVIPQSSSWVQIETRQSVASENKINYCDLNAYFFNRISIYFSAIWKANKSVRWWNVTTKWLFLPRLKISGKNHENYLITYRELSYTVMSLPTLDS